MSWVPQSRYHFWESGYNGICPMFAESTIALATIWTSLFSPTIVKRVFGWYSQNWVPRFSVPKRILDRRELNRTELALTTRSSEPSPSWESRNSENPPELHCSHPLWCRGRFGIQDVSHKEVSCLWSVYIHIWINWVPIGAAFISIQIYSQTWALVHWQTCSPIP